MLRKIISLILCFSFLSVQSGFAQGVAELNLGQYLGQMSNNLAVDKFRPPHLRYFSYDPAADNFQLLLDKGDSPDIKDKELEDKTKVLMEYFQIGLALPNDKFWVNLRPDAQDQVIDPELEKTDLGKVMLESDLQLKKDTASFTSPQTKEGREYWDKLYQKARELFGTEPANIPTITRPWIVPGEIIVREGETSAYIFKANLKVMLEEDYLKSPQSIIHSPQYNFKDPRMKELNTYSTQLIQELIIPRLTKEVNTSKRYAALRQVFFSLILARWFKERFSQVTSKGLVKLIDSGNLTNLTSKSPWSKSFYFNEYKKSFEKGEYNLKEQAAAPYGQVIRSYVSGGIVVRIIKEGYKIMKKSPRQMWDNLFWMTEGLGMVGLKVSQTLAGPFLRFTAPPDKNVTASVNFFRETVENILDRHLKNDPALLNQGKRLQEMLQEMRERKYTTPRKAIADIDKVESHIVGILNLAANRNREEANTDNAKIGQIFAMVRMNLVNLTFNSSSSLTEIEENFYEQRGIMWKESDNAYRVLRTWFPDYETYPGWEPGISEYSTRQEAIAAARKIATEHFSVEELIDGMSSNRDTKKSLEDAEYAYYKKRLSIVSGNMVTTNWYPDWNVNMAGIFKNYSNRQEAIAAARKITTEHLKTIDIIKAIFNTSDSFINNFDRGEPINWKTRGGDTKFPDSGLPGGNPTKASSSLSEFGGIDFTHFNTLSQPIGSFSNLNYGLPTLSSSALQRIDLDKELASLRQMASSGIVPSGARLKEYLSACFQKGRFPEKQDELLLCLAEIYLLLERENLETIPELNESQLIADTAHFVLLPTGQKAGLN